MNWIITCRHCGKKDHVYIITDYDIEYGKLVNDNKEEPPVKDEETL